MLFMAYCYMLAPPSLFYTWPLKNPITKTGMGCSGLFNYLSASMPWPKVFCRKAGDRMMYYQSIASPQHFVFAKLLIQFFADACHEFTEHVLIFIFLLSCSENSSFIGIVFLGGWSLKSCFYFSCSHCCKSTTKCSHHGHLGFPIIIPQLIIIDEGFFNSF